MALKPVPESYCCGCRRPHATTEFYKSTNPFHSDGVIMYCKDSCKKIFDYYLQQTSNIECALWLTCSFLGMPFVKDAYEMLDTHLREKRPRNPNYVGLYMSNLGLVNKRDKQKYTDFSSTDVDYKEVNTLRIAEEAVRRDYERFELDWGKQTVEDYEFLQNIYNKYTEELNLDPQQEDLYRDLCLARLRKRKLENEDKAEETDITKVQNQIFSIMNKLKIDDFESKTKSPVEQLIFEKIKMVEETMPCESADRNKYKDIDSLGKYIRDLLFRPMLNTLVGSRDFNVRDVKDYDVGGV